MIRQLNSYDIEALAWLRRVGFFHQNDPSDPMWQEVYEKTATYSLGYFANDELASVLACFPFKMQLGRQEVKMGGLGGVISAPEYRRQGQIKELMKLTLEQLRETETAWSLLYAFDPLYYRKFGWQSVSCGFKLEFPVQTLFRGAAPKAKRLKNTELELIKPIYRSWAKNYNFMINRNDNPRKPWDSLIKQVWEDREQSVYLLEDAYCLLDFNYGDPNNMLSIKDYAYSSALGRENLLAFWGAFYGQADMIKLVMSKDDPLFADLQPEYTKPYSVLQARVVDVALALEQLACSSEASFSLKVQDAFCEWNNTSFQVEMSEGKTQVTTLSTTNVDLSLSINTLSGLLSNNLSISAGFQHGLLKGSEHAATELLGLSAGLTSFMSPADFF